MIHDKDCLKGLQPFAECSCGNSPSTDSWQARALKAEAERDAIFNWADDDLGNLLCDLTLWSRRHLENLHARENPTSYLGDGKTNGYAVAEIPDWELRQKLEALDIHRAKLAAIRDGIRKGEGNQGTVNPI